MRSRSVDVEVTDITPLEAEGKLMIGSPNLVAEPSHWSFGQFAGWVGAPPAYLRKLSTKLAIGCLQEGVQNSPTKGSLKLMAVSNADSFSSLQAVTSTTYGRIWDADVAESIGRLVERSGGRFHNPHAYVDGALRPSGLYASDHDIFAFMVDGGSVMDINPRAQLHRGFIAWNSETGAKSFGLMGFIFNRVCGNHIIWGAEQVNKIIIRHSQGGPARFDSEAMPTLLSYANASSLPLESSIRRAADTLLAAEVPKDDTERFKQALAYASRHAKFTNTEIKSGIDFAKSEEGDCRTVWHLVQGLTAYARGFDYVDARVDLETRAGKLLNPFNN